MQKLNALPFVFIVANCVCWVAYSFTIKNWYLFVPNTLGFLIGLLLFLVAYGIGVPDKRERDKLTACAMILATVLPIVGAMERLVLTSEEAGQKAWGYTGAGAAARWLHECSVKFNAKACCASMLASPVQSHRTQRACCMTKRFSSALTAPLGEDIDGILLLLQRTWCSSCTTRARSPRSQTCCATATARA
jgi:Sugar efflux transporter for intercellular exchange